MDTEEIDAMPPLEYSKSACNATACTLGGKLFVFGTFTVKVLDLCSDPYAYEAASLEW